MPESMLGIGMRIIIRQHQHAYFHNSKNLQEELTALWTTLVDAQTKQAYKLPKIMSH